MAFLSSFMVNAQSIGWLKVETGTSSKGAYLYVDGQYVSDVPATVALTAGAHKIAVKKDLYLDQELNVTIQANKVVEQSVNLVKNYSDVTIFSPVSGASIYVDGVCVGSEKSKTVSLLYGDHKIKVTCWGYKDYEGVVTVTSTTSSLTIPSLEPKVGYLVVNTNEKGAIVKADGKVIGTQSSLRIGRYSVVVSKPGYTDYKQTVQVTEGQTTTVNASLEKLYNLNIVTDPSSADVRINGRMYTAGGYPSKVVAGEYQVSVEKEGYKTQTKTIKYPEQESVARHYFTLPEYLFYYDSYFYMGVGVQAMRYAGIRLDMGGYISNVNIELNYIGGFRRRAVGSVGIYAEDYYGDLIYSEYNYKPKGYWGIMAGYGVKMGTRMRFTPQLGIGVLNFKGKLISGDSDYGYDKFSSGAFNIAAKFDIALVDGVALYVTPGYTWGFAGKNAVIRDVIDLNSDVYKYTTGFNLSTGVSFYF